MNIRLSYLFLLVFTLTKSEETTEKITMNSDSSTTFLVLKGTGYVVLSLCTCAILALYWFQDNLLYFPTVPTGSRTEFLSPSDFGLGQTFEEVFFRTSDNLKLQAWLFLHKQSKEHATVLFFHGNAGNISHRLQNIKDLFHQIHLNVMILSYRGYGKSEGSPTEAGLKLDAEAALNYLQQRPDIDPTRILLFGRSLGGAVAIDLCSKNQSQIQALIVENTFCSIPDMIDVVFPLLKHVKFLASNRWESIKVISKISIPICFLSGLRDQLVPPSHTQKLYNLAASKTKELYTFPNGEHMDLIYQSSYYTSIAAFLNKI